MHEIKDKEEKFILVAVDYPGNTVSPEESLAELEELVNTAGGEAVCYSIQPRDGIHPGTYVGKGKLEEIKLLADELGATGIVCDDELSPAQLKNISEALDIKVLDRTQIILDIFAKHAVTGEGKVQVELAQLSYRKARLLGMGNVLSRQGGGIGTRGPGEKKLEVDRRLINDRISFLKGEIETLTKHREVTRKSREKAAMPVIAIVGYTNAGKSTLLNKLTDAGVLSENKLFATLDPTTRNLELPSGKEVLLTDTVGFISKLPHNLIDAFRSTLEEAKYADIILHVVDVASAKKDLQSTVVYDTLRSLKADGKPIITAFNKCDNYISDEERYFSENVILKDTKAEKTCRISAKTGEGLEELLELLEETIRGGLKYIQKTFSFNEMGKVSEIRKYGQLLKEEYTEDGVYVEAYVPEHLGI